MDEDLEEVLRKKDDGALSWICAVCSELGELVYCDLCKKGFHIDEQWYASSMHARLSNSSPCMVRSLADMLGR